MTTLLLSAVLGAAPDAALLQRIADRTRALEDFQHNSELTMTVHAEELDGEGAVSHSETSVYRVTTRDGVPHRELVKKEEDGKDVTAVARADDEKDQEKPDKKKKKEHRSLAAASPFHPDEQSKYEFALLAPPKSGPPNVHIAFKPKGEKTPKVMIGDAMVNADTGEVLWLSMRPSKLPLLVDSASVDVELGAQTPAGLSLSKMTIRGQAGLLMLKKRFRVVMTVADYRALAAK